jgi:predicted transcriptional regulator of viral defense system
MSRTVAAMFASQTERVLALVRQKGVLRPRDLEAEGIPREYLSRLHRRGALERLGRGLYVLEGSDPTQHRTLAEVGKRVPRGVICLLSALQFHELTTQMPRQVWLALDSKAWQPQVSLPVRVMRFSGEAFTSGVEEHQMEGVTVRVYSPAKTVADCFKFRNKIGLDVALEALRDCRRQGKCGNDDLWRFAKVCRQTKVMKPYLEAIA